MSRFEVDVNVTSSHLQRLAKCRPVEAIEELVWNAIDAEALNISIKVERNEIEGIKSISIQDNGVGISDEIIKEAFGDLGESQKTKVKTNRYGRVHGRLGEGRFRSYSLGQVVSWITATNPGKFVEISGIAGKIKKFVVDDIQPEQDFFSGTGTLFKSENTNNLPISLPSDEILASTLQSTFAPKLLSNKKLKIRVGNILLDPSKQILEDLVEEIEGETHKAYVRTVIWNGPKVKQLFWCDEDYNVRGEEGVDLGFSRSDYSVFISSKEISEAVDEGTFVTRELTELRNLKVKALEVAGEVIARMRAEKVLATVEELKESNVYPYKGDAASPLEEREREVFDYCAANIVEHIPSFAKSSKDSKKLTLSLLKNALETSPPELERVLKEVLNLTEAQIRELDQVLKRSKLSNLIKLSKTITGRLDFLSGLEEIACEKDLKKRTKERRHLHKIIENEAWMFGEMYTLSSSDESLNTVLKKHYLKKEVSDDNLEVVPAGELEIIPDLIVGRQVPIGNGEELENLVVEIKRPSHKIDLEDKMQLEKYAMKIGRDERFSASKTKWNFYLISTAMHEDLVHFLKESTDPVPGRILAGTNIQAFAYTWADIIQSAKGRMGYIKKALSIKSGSVEGLEYLKDKYPKQMSEVLEKK